MKDPMLNKQFLTELDKQKHKTLWCKIIALNLDEEPLEEIQGRIISGNINVDGSSAVRRTCSLQLSAQDVNVNEFYWSVKTKFRVEIGVENYINSGYPPIIWFKQGMFIISSFNCSLGTNNYSISIQGKDKMSLLNGDFGGVVPSSWDFATEDSTENGEIVNKQIPIKDIILQAVHEFAQEPWQNIIVNDLDDYGIELLEYTGDRPFYYIISNPDSGDNSREVVNMTLDGNKPCFVRLDYFGKNGEIVKGDWKGPKNLASLSYSDLSEEMKDNATRTYPNFSYEKLMERLDPSGNVTESREYYRTRVKFTDSANEDGPIYTIAKITNSNGMQVCGYRVCDIVYPYDLIVAPGGTITNDVLDKLVQMLGNFEYFYNLDGQFVFQKKKTYSDVSYNNIINEHSISDEVWANSSMISSQYSYNFEGNELISQIQKTPNLSNLKNDFSLWGQRQGIDTTYPVHMRYAIDKKPKYYKNFDGQIFMTKEYAQEHADTSAWSFKKTPNYHPIGEDWWEVQDWARYYALIQCLKDKRNPDSLSPRELEDMYYPKEQVREYTDKNVVMSSKAIADRIGKSVSYDTNINVIYITPDEVIPHATTCVHPYYELLPGNREAKVPQNAVVYIYRPVFPGELSYEDTQKTLSDGSTIFDLSIYMDNIVDWREIIFQMAKDYRRHYREPNFYIDVAKNNKYNDYDSYYPKGRTGYENYYIDFEMNMSQGVVAYWRELYNPEAKGKTGEYDSSGKFNENKDGAFTYNSEGWNPQVLDDPDHLNFWFDFLDTTGDLSKYSVHNIGLRSKAVNDDKIKAIYFRETPNVIFETADSIKQTRWLKPGYCHLNIPAGFNQLFNISSRGKNAVDVVDEYLYQYTYPISSLNLTIVPIFNLVPNTLIRLNDKESGAVGDYILKSFSIQLGLTQSMSLTAVETAKRIY